MSKLKYTDCFNANNCFTVECPSPRHGLSCATCNKFSNNKCDIGTRSERPCSVYCIEHSCYYTSICIICNKSLSKRCKSIVHSNCLNKLGLNNANNIEAIKLKVQVKEIMNIVIDTFINSKRSFLKIDSVLYVLKSKINFPDDWETGIKQSIGKELRSRGYKLTRKKVYDIGHTD